MEEEAINWNESREGNMRSLDGGNGRETKCKKKKKTETFQMPFSKNFSGNAQTVRLAQCMGSQSF